jgi:hypothetical protein
MQSGTVASNTQRWAGITLSTLTVMFLLFDGAIKFTKLGVVMEAQAREGFPDSLLLTIGTLELLCTVLYAIPSTSILGAILLTGFLGGAVAIHVRIGDPLFTHTLFPIYLGVLAWGGLFLRDSRLRALIPVRS